MSEGQSVQHDGKDITAVYNFIRAYVEQHGTGPLIMEIADGTGLNNSAVSRWVRILHTQGRIRKTWRRRSISPIDVPAENVRLTQHAIQEGARARRPSKRVFD